jgi:hypothetical protein
MRKLTNKKRPKAREDVLDDSSYNVEDQAE